QTTNVGEAVHRLAMKYDSFIAVTVGAEGCCWFADGQIHHLRPPAVKAVDTLAAGDVFHGAFVLGLTEGMPVEQVIAFANAAAALKCETFGGRKGAPTRAQVEARLRLEGAHEHL